jgi:hypothetical protein
VKSGREEPNVSVQLHDGLQSPNRTVTPMGTTTVCMAGGATCIDNVSDTSPMAMSMTIRYRMSQGRPPRGLYSHHTGSHCTDDPTRHGTIYTARQYLILPYDM